VAMSMKSKRPPTPTPTPNLSPKSFEGGWLVDDCVYDGVDKAVDDGSVSSTVEVAAYTAANALMLRSYRCEVSSHAIDV
jgi:hypothetical protein